VYLENKKASSAQLNQLYIFGWVQGPNPWIFCRRQKIHCRSWKARFKVYLENKKASSAQLNRLYLFGWVPGPPSLDLLPKAKNPRLKLRISL